jgi:hypothetical protein
VLAGRILRWQSGEWLQMGVARLQALLARSH